MTEGTSATVAAWSFGLALAGYLAFALRVAPAARGNQRARLLLIALVVTAAWAAAALGFGMVPGGDTEAVASVADALRYGAWFAFVASLLRDEASAASSRRARLVAIPVVLALIASVLLSEPFHVIAVLGARAGLMSWLCLAVFGLALIEQLVRRVPAQTRWNVKPLAVGLAGIFGIDLFYYADGVLFSHVDPDIFVSRGFANALVLPFLAIATVRNTGWTIDLHLSRGAVVQSSALLASGAFLLSVAGAGYFVRYFGGEWGRALQIELMFAAALTVALVASSGKFRSYLKVFVSKHFFSYRYDYREAWLRFTRTLSTESPGQTLAMRTVNALADLVESPAGVLFVNEESRGFVPSGCWNMRAGDGLVRADDPFAAFLARSGWIVSIDEWRVAPERYGNAPIPDAVATLASPWLIVPLMSGNALLAFAVLTTPRAPIDVDWEVRDLLKTASRQAASYFGHVRATEALLEARKFDAFNRMSAFIVHDLKNLIAQLSLMLRNAQRHRDNADFQADMLATVEHVVGRMNGLMLQLRSGATPVANARPVDLCALVRRVCGAKADARVPIDVDAQQTALVIAHEDRLERVIGHLLQNAIDASGPGAGVGIAVDAADAFATVRVVDRGSGMSAEFVRERLFKPFQTTKAAGMGIGVYESSQYVSSIGGEIRVDSVEGSGTRVEVRLPRADARDAEGGAVIKEQVA
ncbi:MAG TPA: XrtA/PEP-CTERM system histidine kinase PrsK [Casimicrobiaceae bacterium]